MSGPSFIELVALAAHEYAELTAVEAPDRALSHAELWRAAGALAGTLHAGGIGPGDVVGVALEKSAAFLVAWLAVHRVGAAPVVLDPSLPAARVATLVARSGARRVLSAEDVGAALAGRLGHGDVTVPRAPEELAYVVFTSGSSGEPKGVRVPERGLASLLVAQIHAFALGAGSRALFLLSTSFDAMVSDVGTALVSGATLVIAKPNQVATPDRV